MLADFQQGTEISHFRILEKIGAGATGVVYKSEDLLLHRPVALKFLAAIDPENERFLQEARIFSSISHPNIAVIYEAGRHLGIPFFAMELVEGETLSQRIKEGGVTVEQAMDYTRQILEALGEVHSRGIIHRDIKSSNIMVTSRNRIKILDFGLARDSVSETRLTGDGSVLGTVEFLAPEQARGEDADFRSDLFSAGLVLYHLLASKLPFERETRVATLMALMNEEPPPLPPKSPLLERLQAVVEKALKKNPAERYQTADEFLGDLETMKVPAKQMIRPSVSEPLSIAVLYFEKLGEQEESEYLCLGITEDIITDLSKVAGIKVLSRHAVQKFRDTLVDAASVVRELQVDYVLRGTLQKIGPRIRVTAELVNRSGTAAIWTERYDREMEDIFELQEDVAKNITAALQIRLTDSEARSIQQRSTTDLKAYEFYLRGRYHYMQAAQEQNLAAEEMFRQAIRADANFAAAYAGLAEVYVQRFYNWFDRNRAWLTEAERAIEKAYALNDALPEVHCTSGMLLYLKGRYVEAMEEIQKAIRLDPHYALAHDHSGEIYLHTGQLDKAILAFHTELRINADVIYPYFYLVWIHSLLKDFSLAREIVEKARIKHSKNHILLVLQGNLASYSGELEEAQTYLKQALSINPNNSFAAGRLAAVYAQMQRRDLAIAMAELATERIDPLDHHAAFDRGCMFSLFRDYEQSLLWLNKAVDLGWRCGYQFQNEPMLQPVREQPDFQTLLKRMS